MLKFIGGLTVGVVIFLVGLWLSVNIQSLFWAYVIGIVAAFVGVAILVMLAERD